MNHSAVEPLIQHIQSAPWEKASYYAEYIAQIYHFVRRSTRMLAMAAAKTENEAYYDRLVAHISEEDKHEKLALMDLKNLGSSISQHPEMGITRALWEPQFFKIEKCPSSLLGYIYALEVVAAEGYPLIYQKLKAAYGEKCLNFIRVHSEEDPAHVEQCFALIENLPPAERILAEQNYEQTCAVIASLLNEVKYRASSEVGLTA